MSDMLAAQASIRKGMPPKADEWAQKTVMRNIGVGVVQHMAANMGNTVAYRMTAEWLRDYPNPYEDTYRVIVRVLPTMHRNIDTYRTYEAIVPTFPPPMTTKEMLRELWRRYQRWGEQQQPCSYVRPQSSYPSPDSFFF